MFCTPPATTRSAVPLMTAWAAKCTACCDEPHCRSIGHAGHVLGEAGGQPAVRAMSPACGPSVSMQPKIDVVDGVGVGARVAVEQRGDHVRAEVGRVHLRQRAAAPADRGADGVDEIGLRHGGLLSSRTARRT